MFVSPHSYIEYRFPLFSGHKGEGGQGAPSMTQRGLGTGYGHAQKSPLPLIPRTKMGGPQLNAAAIC